MTSSTASPLDGAARHVPIQPTHIPTDAHLSPPSSGVSAAHEHALSMMPMSLAPQFQGSQPPQLLDLRANPQQTSFDMINSTPYMPILPAAVALPDIDYARFATPFAGGNPAGNAPAAYNFDSYMPAAQRTPDTASQSAIQGHLSAPSFNIHQLPLGTVPQNAGDTADSATGYPDQTVLDNDQLDVWMSATSGIKYVFGLSGTIIVTEFISFEELGAYLANLETLTQNALGGSGNGWSGTNAGY